MTICLGRRLPGASSDRYPRARRAAVNALLFGLAPSGVCLAGRSPVRRWALTPPFHPYLRLAPEIAAPAVFFCGTFLRVAPTGCYPAPCSLEPGLSSNRLLGRRSPVRLGPDRSYPCGPEINLAWIWPFVRPVPGSPTRQRPCSSHARHSSRRLLGSRRSIVWPPC